MDSVGSPVLTELVIDVPSVTSNSFEDATKQSSSWILTRLHAGYFRITLSFCGQTLLWKTFGESHFYNSLPIRPKLPSIVFVLLWFVSLIMLSLISLLYILRCFFHLNMVKAEYLHHVGVNYLFVPWISWLLLLQSSPFMSPKSVQYVVVFWLFFIPVVLLSVKIYGQWFTKGKRFLSAVANPASQMSVIAKLVAARAAAKMGWRESAIFFFAIGITHYVVIFVTLYQRPIGIYQLPAKLRPVFFLFIAAPSTASVAWDSVSGSFGTPSKLLFFLSFFHFASLISRPTLFKKSMRRFDVAWWAYSFPLTVLAMASIEYAQEVKDNVAHGIMLALLALSVLTFKSLIAFTAININRLLSDGDPMLDPITRPVSNCELNE